MLRPLLSILHARLLAPVALALLLAACQLPNNDHDRLPAGQPFPSDRLSELRPGMTYRQFEDAFGPGWISRTSPSPTAYWFFDDGHTIAIPSETRNSPNTPLQYRLIGPPLPTHN
jgi:hypothetical protein